MVWDLTAARVAERLGIAWNTANAASRRGSDVLSGRRGMLVDMVGSLNREDPAPDKGRGPVATAVSVVLAWGVILGVVLAFGWLVTHPAGQGIDAFDDELARDIAGERTADLDRMAEVAAYFGDTMVTLVVSPIVIVAVWVWQRSVAPALFVALAVLGVGGLYAVVTELLPRDRPPVEILDKGLVPTHSFPSGHVGTATALYGLLIVLIWVYARGARWLCVPLALLPLGVVAARLYQGAHHLSDVLTSLAYSVLWLAVLTALLLGHRSRRDGSHSRVA